VAARDQARRSPGDRPGERRAGPPSSRLGNDFNHRFPLIVQTVVKVRSRSCIIDGEAVMRDDNGIACFGRIRRWDGNGEAFLYAFDLIELNGDDLRRVRLRFSRGRSSRFGQVWPRHPVQRASRADGTIVFATPARSNSKASCRSGRTRVIAPAALRTGSSSRTPMHLL
jgi:hypothetical protein